MNIGHLTLLVIVVGSTGWYLFDTLGVSTNINNIILVVPLAIIVVGAALFEAGRALYFAWRGEPPEPGTPAAAAADGEEEQTSVDLLKGGVLLAFVGLLVFGYEYVGLDVAVFLFVLAALYLLEAGNYLWKLVFAVVFTYVVVGGAKALLPYPMPTALI